MIKYFTFLWVILLASDKLLAGAACCASKGEFPTLITDHSQSQFSVSLTGSTIIGTSDQSGKSAFFHSEKYDRSFVFNGGAATKISERMQLGVGFPLVFKNSRDLNRKASEKGIGDPSIALGFEIIDPHYGSIPQTMAVLSLGIPAGTSPLETDAAISSVAPGSGHWTLQTGLISLQSWGNWSGSAQALAQYSFAEARINPGWNLAGKLRGGRSFLSQKLFFGLGVGPKWQQAQTQEDVFGKSKKGYRLAWDTGIEASLRVIRDLSISLAYNDQTLLGPTRRSSLSRSLGLSLQLRQ